MATDRGERRRAHIVVGAVLAALLGTAALQQEAWPLSSYRLFSHVRTEEQTGRQLVAIYHDGSAVPLRFGEDNPVLATTAHLIDDLSDEPAAIQRRMVEAWLEMAGIESNLVSAVRVDVVTRTMSSNEQWSETSRITAIEVEL